MNDTTQIAGRNENAVAGRAAEAQARRATISPNVDIFEDKHAVTVLADLPGVPRENLDIRVHDGSLTIEGEATVPTANTAASASGLRLSYAEARVPFFARQFVVSDDFDTSKIEANLKDGVLKLTIPRREESKPRRIEVNVA